MPNGVDIGVEAGVVRMTYHGNVRFALTTDRLAEAVRLALQNGSHWLLVDIRDAHDPYYTTATLKHADLAPSLGIDHRFRIAVLGRPGDERLQYMEDASLNRGLPVRAFDDEARALSWLMGAL